MPKSKLTFAKIVTSSQPDAWSQTYNAGSLAAVVSLKLPAKQEASQSLGVLGKELINHLEAEYFTLETKNLHAIKDAINNSLEKIPAEITLNLLVAAVINNILYVFLAGGGKILLKRKEKFGVLLEQTTDGKDTDNRAVLSASGFLENNDIVLLLTEQCAQLLSSETLTTAIAQLTPQDIAEVLSITLHESQQGNTAASIFAYHEEKNSPFATDTHKDPIIQPVHTEEKEKPPLFQNTTPSLKKLKLPKLPKLPIPRLSPKRLVILAVVIVIVLVLIASILHTAKKKNDTSQTQLFQSIYPQAEKKYEEGESLLSLNKSLAHDDFVSVQNSLNQLNGKFPANSLEAQKIQALQKKVNDALGNTPTTAQTPTDLKIVDATTSSLLAAEIDHPDSNYFTADTKAIYYADSSGITSVDTTKKAKQIIKNDSDWTTLGGLGTYLGNFYVLDKKSSQIIKYVAANDGFGKTNYFSPPPDLSKAASLTIDTSIWVLNTDGSIQKYTRGKQDSFTVSGLTKPLSNPTRIVTTLDETNIYILDNGNSRIVVLNKSGAFQAEYPGSALKNAKDMDVMESQKKIYVLSDKKVYQIDLK